MTKEEKEAAGYAKNLSMVQELLERENNPARSSVSDYRHYRKRRGTSRRDKGRLLIKSKGRPKGADAIKGVGDQDGPDASNKKVFQMQKAYRIAEVTMGAFQAANNALSALFPFLYLKHGWCSIDLWSC